MADFILHSASAETSSGQGDSVQVNNTLIGMFINISEVSGTLPTLTIQLQESPNGTDWYNVQGMVNSNVLDSIGLVSVLPTAPQLIADNARIVWTIGGVNSSFTFEVDLEAIV